MNFEFSDRMSSIKPSAIREVLKKKAMYPDAIIALSTGSPSAECVPVKEMWEVSDKIYRDHGTESLQYSMTEGYIPLRKLTASRLQKRFGINCTWEDVIITTGGQQGLEITPKVLCNPGDVAIVEAPSFVSGINAIKSNGAEVIGIDMDQEGMKVDKLREVIAEKAAEGKKVKLLYLIPTFQNPSGKTMSLSRRKEIYKLCVENNIVILEDNPYGELRFSGEEIPTLKAMDTEGIVIYNGSYSKVISAGMRIGFICAPKEILGRLIVAKQVGDCHTNLFFQMAVAKYLEQYDLDAHIKDCQDVYRKKCHFMLDLMEKHFDKRVSFTHPDGGLFIWASLPEGYDSKKLAELGVGPERIKSKTGVAIVPGCSFMVDDTAPCPAFRVNYSTPSYEDIEQGIQRLAECIDEILTKPAE